RNGFSWGFIPGTVRRPETTWHNHIYFILRELVPGRTAPIYDENICRVQSGKRIDGNGMSQMMRNGQQLNAIAGELKLRVEIYVFTLSLVGTGRAKNDATQLLGRNAGRFQAISNRQRWISAWMNGALFPQQSFF